MEDAETQMIPAFSWLGTALRALDPNANLEAGEVNERYRVKIRVIARDAADALPHLLPQEVAAPNVPARSRGINQPTKRPPSQWALFEDLRK